MSVGNCVSVFVGAAVNVAEGDGLKVWVGVFVSGKVGIAVKVAGSVEVATAVWVGVGVGITLRSGASATAIRPKQ